MQTPVPVQKRKPNTPAVTRLKSPFVIVCLIGSVVSFFIVVSGLEPSGCEVIDGIEPKSNEGYFSILEREDEPSSMESNDLFDSEKPSVMATEMPSSLPLPEVLESLSVDQIQSELNRRRSIAKEKIKEARDALRALEAQDAMPIYRGKTAKF